MAERLLGDVKKVYLKKRLIDSTKSQIKSLYESKIFGKFRFARLYSFARKHKFITVIMLSLTSIMLLTFIHTFNKGVELVVRRTSDNDDSILSYNNAVSEARVLGQSSVFRPNLGNTLNSSFKSLDKRIYVLDQYFLSRNSPLYGQAIHFVNACDKYGAPKDCITTAAIARHETDLCKYANSAEMFNCMGWGGAGVNRVRFSSYEEHLDVATRVLTQSYGPAMMIDPRLMERVFCGPQDECIGWGSRVINIMNEIDNFAVSLGVGRLTDLR